MRLIIPHAAKGCKRAYGRTTGWVDRAGGTAADKERTQMMRGILLRVEMEDKEKGACDIALAPQAPVHCLKLNSYMGAPAMLSCNHPNRIRLPCEARRGGLLLRSSSDSRNRACR